MSFNWGDLDRLADNLVRDYDGDALEIAAYRTAIGRIYYCAFNEAKKFLDAKKQPLDKGSDTIHIKIRTALIKMGAAEKIMARRLLDLYKRRVQADYKDYAPIQLNKDYRRCRDDADAFSRILSQQSVKPD